MKSTKRIRLVQCLLGLVAVLAAEVSLACPDGYSSNMFGICMPNIGPGGAIDPGRLTIEVIVEQNAPILKNLILASRQEAFSRGTSPLPSQIIQEFTGFYAPNVLSVHWGVGGGNDLSIQANSFRFGDRRAIVLDTVVVFRDMSDASVNNLGLWAHELAHVEQYRAWGIDDFAKRYIRDYNDVEAAAERRAQEFLAWRGQRMSRGTVQQPWPGPSPQSGGTVCATPFGSCGWVGPIGWNCVCAINGSMFQGVIR